MHRRGEPTNPYDPNAVAVKTEDDTTIGYLARDMAETFQKRLLRQPDEVKCPAQLRGGADGQSIGVVLDFEEVHVPFLDPHGQPFNVLFNRAGRTERDLSELLGLAKAMLSDGVVNEAEATYLRTWGTNHPDALAQWPTNQIFARLDQCFADGLIAEAERLDERQNVMMMLCSGPLKPPAKPRFALSDVELVRTVRLPPAEICAPAVCRSVSSCLSHLPIWFQLALFWSAIVGENGLTGKLRHMIHPARTTTPARYLPRDYRPVRGRTFKR